MDMRSFFPGQFSDSGPNIFVFILSEILLAIQFIRYSRSRPRRSAVALKIFTELKVCVFELECRTW